MKVYFLGRRDHIWHNGNATAIYEEAERQGKDVVLGDIKWDDIKIVDEVRKAKPDWVFFTGRSLLRYPPLYQIHHIVKKKVFIYDCDEVWLPIHDAHWRVLRSWVAVAASSKKGIAEKYNYLAPIVKWVPQDYDTNMMAITDRGEREYDIVFLGVGDEYRNEIVRKLQEKYKVFVAGGIFDTPQLRGHAMANIYSHAKIVVDLRRNAVKVDHGPSDRVFKALGCGTFLLTYDTPGLRDLFVPKYHLDLYYNENDLFEKIDFYLEHEETREVMAAQGQKEVLDKHTLAHRIPQYWEVMEEFMRMKNVKWPKPFHIDEVRDA